MDSDTVVKADAPQYKFVPAGVAFAVAAAVSKLATVFCPGAFDPDPGMASGFSQIGGAASLAAFAALASIPVFGWHLKRVLNRRTLAKLILSGSLRFGATAFLAELLLMSFTTGTAGDALGIVAGAGLLAILMVPAGLRIQWALTHAVSDEQGAAATSPFTGICLAAVTTLLLIASLIVGDTLRGWRHRDAERQLAQMRESALRSAALGENIGRLTALLALRSEPSEQGVAVEIGQKLTDLLRETERLRILAVAIPPQWKGPNTSIAKIGGEVDRERNDLNSAVEALLRPAEPGGASGRAPRTVQLAADRFLAAIANEIAELQVLEHLEELERAYDSRVSLIVMLSVLLVLIFSVAKPVLLVVRDQNRRTLVARDRALRAFADLEAYRLALEQHYTIVRTRATGEIIYANDRFCTVSGYDRDEFMGKSLRLLNSGVHDKAFFADIFRTTQQGKTWCGEICNRAKDGSLYWDDAVVFPIARKTGEIEQFVVISTGISNRKLTEHALAQANATLQAFMKHAPVCVAMFDSAMRYIAMTDSWKKEFGVETDLIGKSHYEEFPRTPEHRREMHRRCLEGEVICVEEEEIELKDGGVHTHRWEGRPWFRSDGSIGGIVIMTDNIALRKAAEDALRASEERFRSLFRLSPVGVVLADVATSRLLLASEVMSQITGYSIDELQELNFSALTPPEYRQVTTEQLAILKKTGKLDRIEKEYIRKDGSRVPVLIDAVSLSDGGKQDLCLAVVQDITARRATEAKLWRLANIDALTGLPARRLFHENLAKAIAAAERHGNVLAVGLVDLDHFKEVNDSFGHDAGDLLLKSVAERLSGAVRATDTIARLGGDEFAFILSGAHEAFDIAHPIKAMFGAMAAPIAIAGTLRRCTLSMGVTLYPKDAATAADLITTADIALYRAKSLGRNRVEYFAPELRIEIERRQELRQEFEDALLSESLALFYQPIVSLAQNRVTACEAVLKIRHPQRGLLGPEDFAGVLDDPGIAATIGERVFEMALEQMCQWREQGVELPKISINVSAANFRTGRFAEELAAQLAWHRIAPSKIAIEVTEAMLGGRGADTARKTLDRLRHVGIEIYLGDFGTGFASLADLRRLPVDGLKIDRSFVATIEHNESNASLVKAVIQLGHSLGMTATAEGVENEAQLDALRALGCDRVQGSAAARPMTASCLAAYLKRAERLSFMTPVKPRSTPTHVLDLKRSNV